MNCIKRVSFLVLTVTGSTQGKAITMVGFLEWPSVVNFTDYIVLLLYACTYSFSCHGIFF